MPSGRQEPPEGMAAFSAPASLLDLPEEAYGLIYGRISTADSKRAFRQAHSSIYRARPINDYLTSASVTGTANVVPCILAFPCCAMLKRLELHGCDDLEACLSLATLPTDQSRAARRQMSSVHHLRLEGCTMSEKCGALLSCCFPKLRDGCEGASLELSKCDASPVALGSCIEMLQLQHLAILGHKTEMRLADEVFVMLGHATSLKHLEVRFQYFLLRCNVLPLKALSGLKVLKLWRMKPLRLREVLDALPALEVLGIELDHEGVGERAASSTVRQLHVPMVSLDSRPISAAEFPGLEVFVFSGLGLTTERDDDALQLVQRMVSWMSLLPLRAASYPQFLCTAIPHVCAFHLWEALDYSSIDEATACLQALSPLKGPLSAVTRLCMEPFYDDCGWLHAMVDLFPAVEEQTLHGDLHQNGLMVSGCLLTCIQRMPHLRKVGVFLDDVLHRHKVVHDVSDLMAPLIEAHEARRQFQLGFWVRSSSLEELHAFLKAIAYQWNASTKRLAR